MVEALGSLTRTHTCGGLRAQDVGADAVLLGWVHRIRDLGGVTFIDVRDRAGVSQVVVRENDALMSVAKRLGREYVVGVTGVVQRRSAETVNPKLATGEVEVLAREIRLLNEAKTPPFEIAEDTPVSEEVRLKYRYLDLRRARLQSNIGLRHRVAMAVRKYFDANGFWEIETPILAKSTPEGARDFLVPSRIHPGEFYALPQSPQLYKQTLMIAGCDRYFQFARCLRDEDLRADRQPEHTQIDLELSFVTEDDVFDAVEGLFAALWKECLGVDLVRPFPRLTFREAMLRYGSDKPDVRFGREFRDVTALCARSPLNVVAKGAKREDGVGVALVVPGGATEISGTQLRKYEDVVKEAGGGGLTFFKVLDAEREKQHKVFPGPLLDEFLAATGTKDGDVVLFTSGAWEPTLKALGVLRSQLGQPLLAGHEKEWRFLWVREFPMFEWDPDRKGWAPRHHMFTMPNAEHLALLESDPGRVFAQLYDLVLNGTELGSGSIRIHRTDIQERVMKVIGLTHEQAYEKFGFLLEAYRYASPPHGGIGLGFDRIVMLMGGADSIRETIAFPKSASAASLMDGSPGEVEPETLRELHLKMTP